MKTACTAMIMALILVLSAGAEKDRPKKGSIPFGAKSRLNAELVKAKSTSRTFVDVAKFVKPFVVSVSSAKILKMQQNPYMNSPFDFFFFGPPGQGQNPNNPGNPGKAPEKEYRQEGLGSGVIVSPEGYILTNNHVVEGADEITVTVSDNRDVDAEIIGTDKDADIAVLKLKEKIDNLPSAPFGNSDSVEVGEWVLAVGNPFSKKLSHTVNAGIVSAIGRSASINTYENFIQTDASINPGNSGGALVNLAGEVIGINTAIVSTSGGNVGIGFAIPINMARKVMEDLVYAGKVSRGWLGIEMQPLGKNLGEALGLKDNNGVLVKNIMKATPAEKAGFKSGDVIIALNDTKINDQDQLKNIIGNMAPNSKVQIKIVRDKKEKTITVVLAEKPSSIGSAEGGGESGEDLIGIKVRELDPQVAQQYELDPDDKGVLVVSVKSRSSAEKADLHEGDLIQKVNSKDVASIAEYNASIKDVKPGQALLLYVKRGKTSLYIGLKIKAPSKEKDNNKDEEQPEE